MLIFFPTLIFETAFAQEWHTFRKELTQILILSVPAVILSSFLTGFSVVYILGYDFNFGEAGIVGVVMSATDHVVIVSMLKDFDLHHRLTTLIKGETLLNEATVMLIFTLM